MSFKLEESKLRTKVAGSSKRPRNALEKATKKKKKPQNKELKYSIVDSVAGSIQTALPCTPILQSVGQPNIMPRYMHFGQPCDFSQQYYLGSKIVQAVIRKVQLAWLIYCRRRYNYQQRRIGL
ncbi:hypothetical protein ACFX1W_019036 [Malus domestica]